MLGPSLRMQEKWDYPPPPGASKCQSQHKFLPWEFASQINLSLDPLKSGLAIKRAKQILTLQTKIRHIYLTSGYYSCRALYIHTDVANQRWILWSSVHACIGRIMSYARWWNCTCALKHDFANFACNNYHYQMNWIRKTISLAIPYNTNKITFVNSENSDKPGLTHSLIRIFGFCLKNWELVYLKLPGECPFKTILTR